MGIVLGRRIPFLTVLAVVVFFDFIVFSKTLPLDASKRETNEIPTGAIGKFINLLKFGDKIFGEPSPEAGRKVDTWTSASNVNPEEMGTYPEGDILHPTSLARNGIVGASSRWEAAIIPYKISPAFDHNEQEMIKAAMEQFHKLTCIRFVEYKNQPDCIQIEKAMTGCWSSVGKIGGCQVVNLQSPGCLSTLGTPIHELMHAIGFMHEQNRHERDTFVDIVWSNIQSGREVNFDKATAESTDAFDVSYDYRSVMHYSPYAFSSNGQPTIIAKVDNIELGQRIGLSRKDVQKIYRMYDCGQYPTAG